MFICYFYISVETLIFAKVLELTWLKNIEFMKTMNYSLIRILFALVIGLVLVIWPNAAASYIVITVGVAFLIPGVISLFSFFGRKRTKDEIAPRFPIEGIGSLLFGLWLIMMPRKVSRSSKGTSVRAASSKIRWLKYIQLMSRST